LLQIDSEGDEDGCAANDSVIAEGVTEPIEDLVTQVEGTAEYQSPVPIAEELLNTVESDVTKEKKIQKRPGPYKRAEKKRADEELSILKSLAAAVAEPERGHTPLKQDNSDDEDVTFGRYIVTEMKQIKDLHSKLVLKNTITNAIFNARVHTMTVDGTQPQYVVHGENAATQRTTPPTSFHHLQPPSASSSFYSSFVPDKSQNSLLWANTDNPEELQEYGMSFTRSLEDY
jgi:hypothetical protein